LLGAFVVLFIVKRVILFDISFLIFVFVAAAAAAHVISVGVYSFVCLGISLYLIAAIRIVFSFTFS
jgi:hypothetical protein